MRFQWSLILLFAAPLLSSAAPIEEAHVSGLEARQLGGGPPNAVPGDTWRATWHDTTVLSPTLFAAKRGAGCSYEITFLRDANDDKYLLHYQSVFNSGEIERREHKYPINLQYRGSTDGSGRREYYAFLENGCSTFYDDKRAPRGFRLYFTPKPQFDDDGYIKSTFH